MWVRARPGEPSRFGCQPQGWLFSHSALILILPRTFDPSVKASVHALLPEHLLKLLIAFHRWLGTGWSVAEALDGIAPPGGSWEDVWQAAQGCSDAHSFREWWLQGRPQPLPGSIPDLPVPFVPCAEGARLRSMLRMGRLAPGPLESPGPHRCRRHRQDHPSGRPGPRRFPPPPLPRWHPLAGGRRGGPAEKGRLPGRPEGFTGRPAGGMGPLGGRPQPPPPGRHRRRPSPMRARRGSSSPLSPRLSSPSPSRKRPKSGPPWNAGSPATRSARSFCVGAEGRTESSGGGGLGVSGAV